LDRGRLAAAEALGILERFLLQCRQSKADCVLVIHGYGSSGTGGVIRQKARSWLNAQKRKGAVKEVIAGEEFDLFHPAALALKAKHEELGDLLKVCNHGVTVVEL
ncbi:MAG: Smr/MutS family protein, partial [Christensenellaceae bacterium]